ncbi:MAG: beta strand repeat-containing protein, partial [Hyphomonadaceae bacterium]
MRINKLQVAGLRIAGLAVALAGAGAKDASANDVTVSTSTTTPLVTSAPDNNSPGDVTVASGGSINVGAGQTAVTVNTSNDVTVASGGALTSSDANNTTGILIQGGNAGAVSNSGSINLLETYTIADADNDGDLDGPFAQGTNRHGIFLQAVPAFTGSITNAGLINVEGNSSAGIRLDALLTGDLTSSGTISVAGDGSNGIEINTGAGVSGDVILRNNVAVVGTGANGLVVDGDIGGELRINGTWNVSGFHTNLRPADVSDFDADDLQNGGSAILVRSSVAGGITIEGVGVEDDEDDDGDGETEAENDTDDDATATITVFGSSPAVSIQATPAGDVLLGATASGYGLHVRGSVSAIGVYDNFDATALRIAGDAGGNAVTTAGGVAIDNVVSASAAEANAYAVFIGQNADVPVLQNRRVVTSVVGSEAADTAYGFFFDAGANVPTVTNGGVIRAQMFGEAGDAVVIHDASNSLTTINNTGTIQAQVIATDSDPSDDIPPPAITGSAIAIDVSASSVGVTLNQTPDVPFTDDDATDGDSGGRPAVLIEGDILFGSGADTVNLLAGEIRGDIAFGAGADTFNIDDGAIYSGALTDSGGDLTLNVQDGTLNHAGGALNITSATFGDGSQLGVLISDVPAESTFIESTGAITFAAGSRIVPLVPEGLPASGTQVFLTANGGLIGVNNVTGPISGIGTP